jgi:hypothetical protein
MYLCQYRSPVRLPPTVWVKSDSVAMFSLTCCLPTPPLRRVVTRPVPFVTSCRLTCNTEIGWLIRIQTRFARRFVSTGCPYSSQLPVFVSDTPVMGTQPMEARCTSRGVNGAFGLLGWSLLPRHGASSGCGWRNGLRYGG